MLKIQNKPVRIFVRTMLFACLFVLVLFTLLSVYIETNKKKILANLSEQIGKKIKGNISYSDADISVWKTFPYVGLHISNVRFADSLNVPLLKMEKVSFSVSILQYFYTNKSLHDLSLQNGFIHLFTDSSGYTNKYLLRKDSTAPQSKGSIELNGATLENVRVVLENKAKAKRYDVLFRSLDASISNGDVIKARVKQDAIVYGLGFNLARGSYLKNQTLKGYTKISYNKAEALLSFDDKDMMVNDHKYSLKGNFWFSKEKFDLDIITKQAPFEKLKKIFAQNIYSDLERVQIEKPVEVHANLSGSLAYKTIPKITAEWKVQKGKLVVPVATVSDCSFSGSFTNEIKKGVPLTDDNSGIVINDFSGNWEGIQLTGDKIIINNLIQPYADMSFRSSADLRSLNKKLGLRSIQFLSGNADLNFHYNGILKADISIVDHLSGVLKFSNATIAYVPRQFNFTNGSGTIHFAPDVLRSDDLAFTLGSNRFNVDLSALNLSGLSSGDPGKAIIECGVSLPVLNLAELKSLFTAKKKVSAAAQGKIFSAATKIDDALDNGQLKIILHAGAVNYDKFHGNNLRGTVVFYNNDLAVSGVSIDHANGNLLIDGTVKQNGIIHQTNAKAKLTNVDVAKVFRAFNNFGQDGIGYDNLQGKLDATADINMMMDDTGSIVPGSMNGNVSFSLKKGALVNFEPFENMKSFVFKNKDMTHVAFAELKNKLQVEKSKISIPRMEIQSTAIGMFVEGVYDLNKKDSKFNIQVPLKGLKRDSSYVPKNIGLDAKAGTSIYIEGKNDKNGKIKFGLNTTRTIRKIFKR